MKKDKPKKPLSYVSRSVYQKLKEENKSLMRDIFAIVMHGANRGIVVCKWRDKFEKEREFNAMLKEVCMQYLKDHPEYDITKWQPEL